MNLFQKDRLGWEEITVLRFQVCQAHEKSSITLGLPQPFTSSIACCTTSLIKLVYEAQFRVFISKFRQSKNVEWRMTATWFLIKTCSSPLTCKHWLLLCKKCQWRRWCCFSLVTGAKISSGHFSMLWVFGMCTTSTIIVVVKYCKTVLTFSDF